MKPRVTILSAVLAIIACVSMKIARADDPDRVSPSTGTVETLDKTSTEVAVTVGEHLDKDHDWLYRRVEHLFEDLDLRYVSPSEAPIVVPLSPLRVGFESQYLHREDGFKFAATPDFDATVRLPNIERRLKVFITRTDLTESPVGNKDAPSPVRVGLRFAPRSHLDFDIGVRAKIWPETFAALKWTPDFNLGFVHVYPFAKVYAESRLGLGVSGGLTLERWTDRWFVRSSSYANWLRNTAATDWTQTFITGYARAVIQERNYDRLATARDLACGIAIRMSVSGQRASSASLYEAAIQMKRPLHGGWLYGYIEPVVRWDHNFGWHPDVGIRIGFDALFWGLASLPKEVATYCQ